MLWVGPGGERRVTFDELRRRSCAAANALERAGVGRGDRVFLMLPRVPEWWELMLACIRLGAVAMPATTQLTPKDVAYRVRLAGARVAVTDAENAPKLDEAACPSVELRVTVGGRSYSVSPFDRALTALDSGEVDVLPMISARYGLDRGVEALEHARTKPSLKVLIDVES